MSTPLARVRAATRDQHERLDAADWFAAATRDRGAYAQHIADAESFYRAAERALEPHADVLTAAGFAPHERRKHDVLAAERAELAAHGVRATATAADVPAIADLSAAVGVLYVLEGSTLGGVVLARRVHERLDWTSRFYGVYGERTAAMWRAFAQAVDGLGERLDERAMIAAARGMFDVYGVRIAGLAALTEPAHA